VGEVRLGWPAWIGVVADDLEVQRRFYRDVLGFPEIEADESYVMFDLGQGRLLELLARDAALPQYDQRRYQVGFVVDDIRVAAGELEARGVTRISEVEGGPESRQYWCYFRDAEGNVFEIVQRLRTGPTD
jgi:catechol 2,3-dioxygenase-like lactoylglutathione lyase family enzyme